MLEELIEAITHHVGEEESTVLPHMRENLSAQRLAELGEAFLSSRKEHLGDQPEDITRDQLLLQARNAEISVASGATKAQVSTTIRREAEKAEESE